MAAAAAVRDAGHPSLVTFSPKVFIPLTRLCRDSCGYCTFALPPSPGRRAYMTLEEVLAVARMGAEQGCTEALFTLGDKPELAYTEAAAELAAMGYASTLEYVAAAAAAVLAETGLLPHVNAGVMDGASMAALRRVSVSQGLMLEALAPQLAAPGAAHADCPDKDPALRLACLEAAGAAAVPFTTGLLLGIGETRAQRVDALCAIRDSHARHGHVQEVIIQNFRAKRGTAMAGAPEPPLGELLWTVAVARLLLGPDMSVQAPPNLTPEPDDAGSGGAAGGWAALLDAGINDWGGVSPGVTRDWVNPEKPWPHLQALAAATAAAGKILVPRLPLYPSYAMDAGRWLDGAAGKASPAAATLRQMDSEGLARCSPWSPGMAEQPAPASDNTPGPAAAAAAAASRSGEPRPGAAPSVPPPRLSASRAWQVRMGEDGTMEGCASPAEATPALAALLDSVLREGRELEEADVAGLFSARGADFRAVCAAADALRARVCGEDVTYVVNRNINYTNVCTYGCTFCAFRCDEWVLVGTVGRAAFRPREDGHQCARRLPCLRLPPCSLPATPAARARLPRR